MEQGKFEDATSRFLEPSAEIIGSVSGAVLGSALSGPVGAIFGAGAGAAIERGLKEFSRRMLSRREEARIGAAYRYATVAFKERLEVDNTVRADDFMAKRSNGRSDWDEVVEGVLISAQRQHEERKVEHLGYLLANIAFEDQVDGYLANWAIRMANELTWAQFVLLAMVGEEGESELPDVEIGKPSETWNSFGIHEQLADLGFGRRGMIAGETERTPRLGLTKINLRVKQNKLVNGGILVHSLMWLDRIPARDRIAVRRSLAGDG